MRLHFVETASAKHQSGKPAADEATSCADILEHDCKHEVPGENERGR